jgi:hypothetical protein
VVEGKPYWPSVTGVVNFKKSQLFIWISSYAVCHIGWLHLSPPPLLDLWWLHHSPTPCLCAGMERPLFRLFVMGFLNHRLNIIEWSGKGNKNTEWVKVLATVYLKMRRQWLREIICNPLETRTLYWCVERSDDGITVICTYSNIIYIYVCVCVCMRVCVCDELINRPDDCYWLWRVVACDQETFWTRRP